LNQTLTEQELYALIGAVALLFVISGVATWWRRRPRDPEQAERKRRARVNQVGRIVEGYVLEIFEVPLEVTASTTKFTSFRRKKAPATPGENGSRKLVRYSYSISGVTYEAAQDLTDLEERACLERLVNGQHVSVKYEPSNPSNSILVADDWSGLQ
jgi:hypothetical protein